VTGKQVLSARAVAGLCLHQEDCAARKQFSRRQRYYRDLCLHWSIPGRGVKRFASDL
jgi:hypothetical protein